MFFDAAGGGGGRARSGSRPVLETIERGVARPGEPALVFLHGAFAGAWCFEEHYLDFFAARGYRCVAVSLRGHGASEGRERLDHFRLADYVEDLRSIVEAESVPPVVVGHSMGGLITQMALSSGLRLRAALLLAPVSPGGLMPPATQLAVTDPGLFWQMLLFQGLGPDWIELEYARRALLADPLSTEELARYARLMQPESARALLEMSWPRWLDTARIRETPLAVFSAAHDAIIPAWMTGQVASLYGVSEVRIPAVGHAMMLDGEWLRSAKAISAWLEAGVRYQR